MYSNEMQRSVGFGYTTNRPTKFESQSIIPYGHFSPYQPGRGFGDVPNDFEASVDLQYIPVRQGWYYGAPVDGRGYPDASGAFGDLPVVEKKTKFELVLQTLSTLSVVTIATIALMRVIHVKRYGRDLLGDD